MTDRDPSYDCDFCEWIDKAAPWIVGAACVLVVLFCLAVAWSRAL